MVNGVFKYEIRSCRMTVKIGDAEYTFYASPRKLKDFLKADVLANEAMAKRDGSGFEEVCAALEVYIPDLDRSQADKHSLQDLKRLGVQIMCMAYSGVADVPTRDPQADPPTIPEIPGQ